MSYSEFQKKKKKSVVISDLYSYPKCYVCFQNANLRLFKYYPGRNLLTNEIYPCHNFHVHKINTRDAIYVGYVCDLFRGTQSTDPNKTSLLINYFTANPNDYDENQNTSECCFYLESTRKQEKIH